MFKIYLQSFGYDVPDDGLVHAETCSMNIVNDECLFVIGSEICLIECCIVVLSHGYGLRKLYAASFDESPSCLRRMTEKYFALLRGSL